MTVSDYNKMGHMWTKTGPYMKRRMSLLIAFWYYLGVKLYYFKYMLEKGRKEEVTGNILDL